MLPDRPMTHEEVLEAVDRAAHDVFLEEWDRLEREEARKREEEARKP